MILNLTLVYKDEPILLMMAGNFAVIESDDGVGCVVLDGVHNNGGWKVKETREEVVAMIKAQVMGQMPFAEQEQFDA